MSAWVLPDHIADVLPSEARHIEELRRELLDTARGYGYELVMPPLLEHLESLLTGTGEALDLQTFKLVDQLSGRMLGLRADTTPQVARIDAHLLNRQGVARLCYCGPVLHTRPDRPHATREPLQFGAEIYGHAGLEADLEVLLLALDCLKARAGARRSRVDMADARIVRALLRRRRRWTPPALAAMHAALAAKDASELATLTARLARPRRATACWRWSACTATRRCWTRPRKCCPRTPPIARRAGRPAAGWPATCDGARGAASTWPTCAATPTTAARASRIYAPGASDALVRGGRYDEVGAVFGRNRPAVGFSLDVQGAGRRGRASAPLRAAIRAPWGDGGRRCARAIAALRARRRDRGLRAAGPRERSRRIPLRPRAACDAAGRWVVQAL